MGSVDCCRGDFGNFWVSVGSCWVSASGTTPFLERDWVGDFIESVGEAADLVECRRRIAADCLNEDGGDEAGA